MKRWAFPLILLFSTSPLWAEEFVRIPTVLHVHSTVSEKGRVSIPDIARLASGYKIKAVIVTDTYLARVEYGLPPWRHLLRAIKERRSVLSFGLARYLRLLEEAGRTTPDVLVLPGVEITPFYYWEGRLPHLKLVNWNKHLLVFGLHHPSDYKFTVMSKPYFFPWKWGLSSFGPLWAFLFLGGGVFLLRKRAFDYRDASGRSLGPYSKTARVFGSFFLTLALLAFLNHLLDSQSPHDPYHGDRGEGPYQRVIDEAREKGGLVFWAHPEAIRSEPIGPIDTETPFYANSLLDTAGYTGFAVYWEGFKHAGQPGGEWDEALVAYCRGKRPDPVWAIGESEYVSEGENGIWFNTLQTVLFAKGFNEASLLEAFQKGRMYTLARPRDYELVLETFQVEDQRGLKAGMGEELVAEGEIRGRLSVTTSDGNVQPIKVRIVRDGNILKTFDLTTPCDVHFEDQGPSSGKTYYRADVIRDQGSLIITNPIFVRRESP